MTDEVRLLTVRQPYAHAIASGHKRVENRGQNTTWRGLLLIHAGAAWSVEGGADQRVMWAFGLLSMEELTRNDRVVLAEGNPHEVKLPPDYRPDAGQTRIVDGRQLSRLLPRGVVVAVARIADSHRASGCCRPWGNPFYNGKPAWHWVLADVRQLAVPVPAQGCQGMRKAPAGLTTRCLEAAGW